MNENVKMDSQKWHALSSQEIFELLESAPGGLSESQAQARLVKDGKNEIADQGREGSFWIFLSQFKSPLVFILIAASAVSLALGDLLDAGIIAAAVLLNAGIGFFQELKVSHVLHQLLQVLRHSATVIRDGRQRALDSRDIAVGDVIVLRQGEKVPADARLLLASDIKTNEAVLTGESMPAEKTTDAVAPSVPVGDQTNMVFMGTFVEEGSAEAVVVATGSRTEFGKIADLIRRERGTDVTPLQVKLQRLSRVLGILFVLLSTVVFVVGIANGHDILTMFLTAVAVAVAAVPEGLPVALTVILAIGARRILAKGGLIRKISAAEALGGMTVIAADKTATLTEGKMHVASLVLADGTEISADSFLELVEYKKESPALDLLRWLPLVTNVAIENPSEPAEQWRMHGKPVEKAIVLSTAQSGLDRGHLLDQMPKIDELAFDSRFKYSATLHHQDSSRFILVFGAPEVILKDSSELYLGQDQTERLSKERRQEITKKVEELAGQGLRVLGFSVKLAGAKLSSLERAQIRDLQFVGLVVFSDPIRPEAAAAIRIAKEAGMRPIMITGDHMLTARYIAKQVGITDDASRVIEGAAMPEDLAAVIDRYDVFARVSPEDKVKIVKALKARGETVAMLGDGINDAPALLRSDIGVAVGSGTDVAKEASDLILLNDSFSIVVEAIRQGRIILDNIKKVTIFLLSNAFSEIFLITISIILKLPLPLLPAQILWVNIIEDILPAISLAFERAEEGIMQRKPESNGRILSYETKWFIATFAVITNLALFGLFYFLYHGNGNISYVRTMIFSGLGITSLFYIFSVRSLTRPIWKVDPFSNWSLLASVGIGLALYGVAIYVPFFQKVLETVPLSVYDWAILVGLALLNVAVVEAGKAIFFRKTK